MDPYVSTITKLSIALGAAVATAAGLGYFLMQCAKLQYAICTWSGATLLAPSLCSQVRAGRDRLSLTTRSRVHAEPRPGTATMSLCHARTAG